MWRFYRRNLPHWRKQCATYFVTWRIDRGRGDLEPSERDRVVRALRRCADDRYSLRAYVVMNDHVHVLVAPRRGLALETIVQSWKSSTAHQLRKGTSGRVWQSEYMDRIVRDDIELKEKIEYVIRNPFTRWPSLKFYPWVWADDMNRD